MVRLSGHTCTRLSYGIRCNFSQQAKELDYLTDDGLLSSAAQINRSVERLKHDDYHVIYQMG